jgi:endonuclease YncB( thermonuclease family)
MGCVPSKDNQTIANKPKEVASAKENDAKRPPLKPDLHNNHSNVPVTYQYIPPGAVSHRVRNVYDGDTLTLDNGNRIRFLGVDCPELKEKHPFALEAKQYTKDLCEGKEVWLSFESNSKQKDNYGRLLAVIWVASANKDGYVCINEGLVYNGYATIYAVDKVSLNDKYFQKLIMFQRHAREHSLGIWKNFRNYHVLVTRNGAAYHRYCKDPSKRCQHLRNSKNPKKSNAARAMDDGLHPCRSCISGLVPQ